MKVWATNMRPLASTTPTPTYVKCGSTRFRKWLPEATKAAWRAGSDGPIPTFSPSFRQFPVTRSEIRECHIRRAAAMVPAQLRDFRVRFGRT